MSRIIFGNAASELANILSTSVGKVGILVDENTEKFCLPLIIDMLPENHLVIKIQSGELNKTIKTCEYIWSKMTDHVFHRSDILINLGGGVIGDMGGFCASTYKRGLDFYTIPTTLLSQVDASVGGKLGVDFSGFKNHIGLFQEPNGVIIDTQFLKTLDERQVRSGFAEILKHGLIKSKQIWVDSTSNSVEAQNWPEVVKESIALKSAIVASDFKEAGERKLLNFGHTIGHGIESHFLDTKDQLLHGEAIAAGIIMEAYISCKTNGLPENQLDEIVSKMNKIYGSIDIRQSDIEPIIGLIRMDKKNKDNRVLMTLLKEIGSASFDHIISEELVRESFDYYSNV